MTYLVKYKKEHYSNSYGSICGSTKTTHYDESFDTVEEAKTYIKYLNVEELSVKQK